ncbi:DUF3037 domain-containing protein [Mucilaginibacter xinganensis]|uniref:DUF3037 domain-containing protein n=1 Tax=Mucilaginibacter xinganensis TaxID=1234841 RepID=A0A223P1A3_9SPHI|nr:DUF3037 domain-containing protein [Mucilaginibacter xinganensis]ASU35867.1 hypothetical protein MuYL_3982 [Mucilaginibacter xinganensis]
MQQKQLFEYAVIRVVPRVEREEFLNIGVILFCAKQKFLQTKYLLDEARLKACHPGLDLEELKKHLCSFERICHGGKDAGPIGQLDQASRFRWLTATRSTVLQTSKVHPGISEDALATLNRLFEQLVM